MAVAAAERTPLTFVRFGPSQRFLRGLRPLVSVGPLPLPESAGAHASRRPPQPEHHYMLFKKTGQDFWSVFFVDVIIFRSA